MLMLSHVISLIVFIIVAGAGQAIAQEKDPQVVFNTNCRQCHTMKKDDNRLGPSLFGVVGKKAGTATNFAYSPSLKNSGVTWDEATLDKWIENPEAVISGNTMKPYTGITDAKVRSTIIAFLKQKSEGQ